jgi:hypothetical protein
MCRVNFVFHYQVVLWVYSTHAVFFPLETGISEDQRGGKTKWTCVIGDKTKSTRTTKTGRKPENKNKEQKGNKYLTRNLYIVVKWAKNGAH